MRVSLSHRLTAGLVVACFALFSVEAAVAAVHDADDSSSAGAAQAQGAAHPVGPASESPQRHDVPGDSEHPVQVCHCAHGHADGPAANRLTVPFAPAHNYSPEIALARDGPSRPHEPLIRPPIV